MVVLYELDIFVLLMYGKLAVFPERFQVFLPGRSFSKIVHVGLERRNLVTESEDDDRDYVTEENHQLKERPEEVSRESLCTVICCLMVHTWFKLLGFK